RRLRRGDVLRRPAPDSGEPRGDPDVSGAAGRRDGRLLLLWRAARARRDRWRRPDRRRRRRGCFDGRSRTQFGLRLWLEFGFTGAFAFARLERTPELEPQLQPQPEPRTSVPNPHLQM